MIMESMMKLPDDIFRLELIPYLTVYDIVRLDTACMNHEYRPHLLDMISGVILTGDKDKSINLSLFKWLGMRRIYWINMNLDFIIENDYVDQFRYSQHVVIKNCVRDDIMMFIISRCPCLQSIYISGDVFDRGITDPILGVIAEYCTGLQLLSLNDCRLITDTRLITMSEHCPNLLSMKVDVSINYYSCQYSFHL